MNDDKKNKKHHIWCNYFSIDPSKCKMCKRLYKEYPIDNMTPTDMIKKYFPKVIIRGYT